MFPSSLPELVPWVVFLVPGWLAIVIAGAISDVSPSGDLHFVFASFVMSAVSYAIASLVYFRLVSPPPKTPPREDAKDGAPEPAAEQTSTAPRGANIQDARPDALRKLPPPPIYVVFVVAGVLGVLLGIGLANNFFYTGLRLIPFGLGGAKISDGRTRTITLKEAIDNRLSYWSHGKRIDPAHTAGDGGNAQNYFRITLEDNIRYEGIIDRFETGSDETDMYLNPACQVTDNGVVPVLGPGVIIYERSVRTIEIIDRAHSACSVAIDTPAP